MKDPRTQRIKPHLSEDNTPTLKSGFLITWSPGQAGKVPVLFCLLAHFCPASGRGNQCWFLTAKGHSWLFQGTEKWKLRPEHQGLAQNDTLVVLTSACRFVSPVLPTWLPLLRLTYCSKAGSTRASSSHALRRFGI